MCTTAASHGARGPDGPILHGAIPVTGVSDARPWFLHAVARLTLIFPLGDEGASATPDATLAFLGARAPIRPIRHHTINFALHLVALLRSSEVRALNTVCVAEIDELSSKRRPTTALVGVVHWVFREA